MALQLQSAAPMGEPMLRFLWPPANYLFDVPELPLKYTIDGPFDRGFVRFTGAKVGGLVDAAIRDLQIGGFETGTYWATADVLDVHHTPVGKPTTFCIDRVLSRAETYRERPPPPRALLALPAVKAARPQSRKLCFVAGNSPIDGQKRIWLRLMETLRQHPTISYSFHVFILTYPPKRTDPFTANGISVTYAPMTVTAEEAATYALTPNNTMEQLVAFATAKDRRSFHSYLPRLWADHVEAFAPCKGAVLIFGNSRDHSDAALALVGRRVRTAGVVFELSSVGPMPITTDALVSPSHYALAHPSVQAVVKASHRYIIPPGIDSTLFAPAPERKSSKRCLTVGYVGRIDADKSLGLLAEAAKLLVAPSAGPCMDFRWVGDGADIDYYRRYPITLLGGIYNETDLVRELQSWDIAVHAGLRETFCIANIEVMAVGLPLVTFGVAGTTEYVRHDVNAWVVDEMSPAALADGIRRLAQDGALRRRLGDAARATVVKQFQWRDTVAKYDERSKMLQAASRVPQVQILWPPQGYLADSDVPVNFTVDEALSRGFVRFSGAKVTGVVRATDRGVAISGIEPGTHWTSVETLDALMAPVGASLLLHIERVLSRDEWAQPLPLSKCALFALPAAAAARPSTRHLCFLSSEQPIDGQKRIWLRLIQSLRQHPTTRYTFSAFMLHERSLDTEPFTAHGVPVTYVPVWLTGAEAAAYGLTSNSTLEQLVKFATSVEPRVWPDYLRRVWEAYSTALAPCKGGVVLYGNNRNH
ncbi:hypothetical protein ACHHYP_06654, partial [Achlya hypogyna]